MANVSVCIATFNGEKFIEKQIKSILNQTITPDEIIISDDNSTDNTINIIKNIIPKAKIFYNNKKGVVSNFENAIEKATGDYIFLSDQDDEWKNNKIEEVIKLLDKYAVIIHNTEIIDENSNLLTDKSFFDLRNSKNGIINNLIKSTYLGCAMAFRKEVIKNALPFPKNIEMHDRWIGLIGEISGGVYFYNKKLIGYRRHNSNTSNGFDKSSYSKIKQFSIRFYILKEFIKRFIKIKINK